MDKRWQEKIQQLNEELSGNGQEHEPADPVPLVEASAGEAAKSAAPTGSDKEKIKVKPRPSVLMTEVGRIELDGNGSDPGDSGNDSPAGKESNSQADPDDFQDMRNVTTRVRKKKQPQTTYLQTLSQEAPQLPLIHKCSNKSGCSIRHQLQRPRQSISRNTTLRSQQLKLASFPQQRFPLSTPFTSRGHTAYASAYTKNITQ